MEDTLDIVGLDQLRDELADSLVAPDEHADAHAET